MEYTLESIIRTLEETGKEAYSHGHLMIAAANWIKKLARQNADLGCSKSNEHAFNKFDKGITENQKDLDPEYSKLVDDHFWELI
jgi:transcription termination factor NusB